MQTTPSSKPFSSIPGYSQNAVLQLIVASGVGFILYHFTRVVLLVLGADASYFNTRFIPNIGLSPVDIFSTKAWTLFIYNWTHDGFWALFTNMVWLYAFGSIVQSLVSYKQLIPIFLYSCLLGGAFYELGQLLPNSISNTYAIGAQAGVAGIAIAAITLSPSYRVYLAEHFSIPISIIIVIFFALIIVNTNLQTAQLFLVGGGSLTGFVYVTLLKAGYQPGMWIYNLFDRMNRLTEPDEQFIRSKKNVRRNEVMHSYDEPKNKTTQKRIDDILDKINQKGYNSLTQEEKDILMKASKDKNP